MIEKAEKPIPENLINLYKDHMVLYELRDAYVKRPLGFKKALKAGRLARNKKEEFWLKLTQLYPEFKRVTVDTARWVAYEGEVAGP